MTEKDEILSELAALPGYAKLRFSDIPLGWGATLTAEHRERLLSLSSRAAVALATEGGSPVARGGALYAAPPPPLPAFKEGDSVALTKDGETVVGHEVPAGTRGTVSRATPDVVLVEFPQGAVDFYSAAEADANLVIVLDVSYEDDEEEEEEDEDDEDDFDDDLLDDDDDI